MNGVLSVLIPVVNWDLEALLSCLEAEIESRGLADQVEVIIGDDGSESGYLEGNRRLAGERAWVEYHAGGKNIGRGPMRNLLASRAKGEYLLLLDADMLPDEEDFLSQYLEWIDASVQRPVCGGISYRQRCLHGRQYDFYTHKGVKTEALPAALRNRQPWRYFFTGNVMVKREIFTTQGIDEQFQGYGYEDVEWGIRLQQRYGIIHIDNTCSHLGLINRERAFLRMRASVDNFHLLQTLHPEYFQTARIGMVTGVLSVLPAPVLRLADRVLCALFRMNPGRSLSLLFFQLDKAVLLVLAARKKQQ
ncbi:MAG: family 2 glycosyl transferase [Desulfobulbus propionicus]|nr:MAG: family 2 glycosyl transferase [Desulfobulbus propionicus]